MYLKNDKIYLTDFNYNNINTDYISWLNDTVLMRFSNQRKYKHTKETCKSYLGSFKNTNNLFLGIFSHEDIMIGTMTAYVNKVNKVVDIGMLIGHQNFRSKGYGFSAWCLLQEYFLHQEHLYKVTAGTVSCNFAMKTVIEKSKMNLEYKKTNHFRLQNKKFDVLYYAKYNKSPLKKIE